MNLKHIISGVGACALLVSPLFAGQRENMEEVASYLQETQTPVISRENFEIVTSYSKSFGPMKERDKMYGDVVVRFKQYNSGAQHVEVLGTLYNGDYSFTTYRVGDGESEKMFDGHVDFSSRKTTHLCDIARKFTLGRLLVHAPKQNIISIEEEFGLPPIVKRFKDINLFGPIVETVFNYIIPPHEEIRFKSNFEDRRFFREGIDLAVKTIDAENTMNHE